MNLARGISILRVFTIADRALGNKEICERTGLPKATVSRLCYTLTQLGCLTRDPISQKFVLGWGVLAMCHPLLGKIQIRQAARPLMEELATTTGCTVNLGIRDRNDVVYIESVRGDKGNRFTPDIGMHVPWIAAAIGRALILGYSRGSRESLVNQSKVQEPKLFEIYSSIWEADIRRHGRFGYCESEGDWLKGDYAIAMPVRCPASETPIAMSCTLFGGKEAGIRLRNKVLPHLREKVNALEEKMLLTEARRERRI
ncbi:helix-turn-helix domain-containing protein [Paraburkholderia sp. CNPSo 3157]|nr:helix-turn-helix domain-containing protein [Paraburkholderia franconis]